MSSQQSSPSQLETLFQGALGDVHKPCLSKHPSHFTDVPEAQSSYTNRSLCLSNNVINIRLLITLFVNQQVFILMIIIKSVQWKYKN